MSKLPNPTDKHVGKRVRMRRLMLRMSQGKLASELGLTFQQVQKYEKGVNRISASRLQQISHLLQVPVQFFFDGGPAIKGAAAKGRQEPIPRFVSDLLASSDGLALASAFTRLKNTKLRRRIVQLLKEIAGEGAEKN